MDKESNLADHGVRKYEIEVGVFTSIDALWEEYRSWSPYQYAGNNPIMSLDWNGMNWFRNSTSNDISWYNKQGDFSSTETYETFEDLGRNVIVGQHNRGKNYNEKVGTAEFELYLENYTEGPTATIDGNTIPTNLNKRGVLKEGEYDGVIKKQKIGGKDRGDLVILLNNGVKLPSLKPNPAHNNNYVMDEIFIHWGAKANIASSNGCQTLAPGRKDDYNEFMSNFFSLRKDPVGLKIKYLLLGK